MKVLIGLSLMAAMVFGADAPPAKKGEAPLPAAAKVQGIPAGAVEIEPGAYRFTDHEGKTWIYRTSPFGIMRVEEKAAPPDDKDRDLQKIKATEDGDSNRFERPTPFGVMRVEEKAAPPDDKDSDLQKIKATEDGDSVRFERPTPFGPFRWQKKKTELNETEKAVWELQQQNQTKRAQE